VTSSELDTHISVANDVVEQGRSENTEFARPEIKKKSKHALRGAIIRIHRGLAIYQTYASPFYFARVLERHTGKYVVRRAIARSADLESNNETYKLSDDISTRCVKSDRTQPLKSL
jgi:hypothetical protein